ncbi:MAG TPA: hypothetical protein VFI24_22175 [Pyrinomonadaceae bacterium]|nr:hypothetical protein [Pyrinomonadaceae bacterium]
MNTALKRTFEVYVFVFAFLFASRPLSDGDFWWHLKTGQFIVHNFNIPRQDFYSFTNPGKYWVAHEWLSEVIFYVVYSRLGFNTLIFLFTVLTVLAFWVVFRRLQAHPFIKGVAVLLSVWSILPTIGVRPRTFTLLFAGIYLAVLHGFVRQRATKVIWWLVPLMIVWVNLHAGYLIGLVLIGLTMVGVVVDAWFDGQTLPWPRLKTLALVFIACLVAVNLNPQGPRIFLFPFEFFFSPIQQDQVIDWLSPDFHQKELLPLLALILLTIAALALSPKRVRPSELLLFLFLLYATLKSNRHMAILSLVAGPMCAEYLQYWLETTRFGKTVADTPANSSTRRQLIFNLILMVPLIACLVKLKSVIYSPPTQERVGVPLNAVAFIKENRLTGNTFTDPNIWGGYLIWETPQNPVYIDGRIDMYGDEFVKDYLRIIHGLSPWQDPFDKYAVQLAILSPASVLRLQLEQSPQWQKVYSDEMAVVFQRKI